MGSLIVPASGTVYIDAQIAIYTVERHPRYALTLQPLWLALASGAITVATSELTILECLVHPMRRGDRSLEAAYETLFSGGTIRLAPIDRHVLREAAKLRASIRSLRAPDAIHAATAAIAGVSLFLTNDRAFRVAASVAVTCLDDVLTSP
jgi:predicted nucleic acid-binding protein